MTESSVGNFLLKYRIPNSLSWQDDSSSLHSDVFEWGHKVPLGETQSTYLIDLDHFPQSSFVGSFVTLNIKIKRFNTANTTDGDDIICETLADPNVWIVSGKQRAICQLSNGEWSYSIKLLAVTCGLLPYPRISLKKGITNESIDSSKVWSKHASTNVPIYPTGAHTSQSEQFKLPVLL